jgi:hypothetical protein
MKSVLLIDDDQQLLAELAEQLRLRLGADAEVKTWSPTEKGTQPRETFDGLADADTALVVTDYDLTQHGVTGLFGTSIVSWSQARSIPVGDFSRGNPGALPKEPDLFEVRIPTSTEQATVFIAALFRGFTNIESILRARKELLDLKSPAAILAEILGVGAEDSQFMLYGVRLGTASGALLDKVTAAAGSAVHPSDEQKIRLLTYIVGHLLLNAVLRFPGPILSIKALQGYLGTNEAAAVDVQALFDGARYAGPFSEVDQYFWLSRVNDILDPWVQALPADISAETQGEINRRAIEEKLQRALERHGCPRCHGLNGGFYCPFTKRTVCVRKDCSVGSNSWIPPGAKLCRIERDFFDEWAPILGL